MWIYVAHRSVLRNMPVESTGLVFNLQLHWFDILGVPVSRKVWKI